MNRLEMARRILVREAAANELRRLAAQDRAELEQAAREEHATDGTAVTWRWPDIGTVTLPVSQEAAYVANEDVFTEWCKRWHPYEVEHVYRVRQAFRAKVLAECRGEGDKVVWMPEGALVPGLAVRPGGQPQALRFVVAKDAKSDAAVAAQVLVGGIEAAMAKPVVVEEAPHAAP